MILKLPKQIYISSSNVDMRKSINGLSYIVTSQFKLDVFSDALFVFHNKHCNKVKMLYWNREGFCLLYKQLERAKFRFPKILETDVYTISNEELEWLLHGLHFEDLHYAKSIKK